MRDDGINIGRLLAGSEGTLGALSEITLRIVPLLQNTALLLLSFDTIHSALSSIGQLLELQPIAIEMVDSEIISLGRSSPSMRGRLDWLPGNPKALLMVEVEGKTPEEAREKIEQLKESALHKIGVVNPLPLFGQEEMKAAWDLRKSGLTLLLSKRSYSRAIAFLEDLALPPLKLAPFMDAFMAELKIIGKKAGIYGHVGAGCMHIRPYFNLEDPAELALMQEMMLKVTSLVIEYGGTLSGEHGDGYIRSWLNRKLFGERIAQAFIKVKEAFDPAGLMNPGKVVPDGLNPFEQLRTKPNEKLYTPSTLLDFDPEGGFALAADLCNGNGLCRKAEGLMCPSFQATGEEFHSTRARAQALRAIIHGKMAPARFYKQSHV